MYNSQHLIKKFFIATSLSTSIFFGQAIASEIVVNKDSLFYPKNEIQKVNGELVIDESSSNPYGIEVKKGRYFFTWTSEEVNKMLTNSYLSKMEEKKIEDIFSPPQKDDDFRVIYSQRNLYSLNIITISENTSMQFDYKNPVTGIEESYRPKKFIPDIKIIRENDNVRVIHKRLHDNFRKEDKEKILEEMKSEDYFRDIFVNSFGILEFTLPRVEEIIKENREARDVPLEDIPEEGFLQYPHQDGLEENEYIDAEKYNNTF